MKSVAIAVAALLTLSTGVAIAQDDDEIEDETKTAYACIAYQVPTTEEEPEPYGVIEEGDYEWVRSADCIQQPEAERPMPKKPIRTKSTAKSKPFWLPEGDYEVKAQWKGRGCYQGLSDIQLFSIDDDYRVEQFERGTDYTYDIEEGLYYIKGGYDTGKGCRYTLRIKPFEY